MRLALNRLAVSAAAIISPLVVTATASSEGQPFAALDKAILTDMIAKFSTNKDSTCNSTASADATTTTFDWPGTNDGSKWYAPFVQYEMGNFQAMMTHTDSVGNNTWIIRIGSSGNMYSHYVPNQYGETMPSQKHPKAPWIDEVQQSVSVNTNLNKKNKFTAEFCPGPDPDFENKTQCKPYYIHQAGAYQEDSPATDVPFFSPSLAKHCSGNYCIFASWGTHAHVETPFTSPIIFINKYTNCDNGVIEHTQMLHNFANPSDPLIKVKGLNVVDQNYFNVGWGGVRARTLPIALEPDPTTGALDYMDVNTVDFLPICGWGGDAPGGPAGRAARKELKQLGGYTSFVEDGLLVNQTFPEILPACRKASESPCTSSNWKKCMKPSCTDADIVKGDVRIELKIAPNKGPNCAYKGRWQGLVLLDCNLHDIGFGRTTPNLQGGEAEACSPWTDVGFFRGDNGRGIDVAYVRHWSWRWNNQRTTFAVYSTDAAEAIQMVNALFDNTGNSDPLPIEVRPTSNIKSVPDWYNPSALNAFTYVYGKGVEYGNSVEGSSRRRIGASARDYTVFTINWHKAKLQVGSTYANRGFYFNSNMANVKTIADDLVAKTHIDEIPLEQWAPRKVNIYQSGTQFAVLAASSSGGQSTSCSSFTPVCSGTSTPATNKVPFFYIKCGNSTHFGPDPYHFTPSFGNKFPGHGNMTNMVRSYVCGGQSILIRPSWKLMGFFDPDDSACAELKSLTYKESVCPTGSPMPSQEPSRTPSNMPSESGAPSTKPSVTPSQDPSVSPSEIPSGSPSTGPSDVPSKKASESPSQDPSVSPSDSPSGSPSTSPSDVPSKKASESPSQVPSVSPSEIPSGSPSTGPSYLPSGLPSNRPSKTPSLSPSEIPSGPPSTVPSDSPSSSPTETIYIEFTNTTTTTTTTVIIPASMVMAGFVLPEDPEEEKLAVTGLRNTIQVMLLAQGQNASVTIISIGGKPVNRRRLLREGSNNRILTDGQVLYNIMVKEERITVETKDREGNTVGSITVVDGVETTTTGSISEDQIVRNILKLATKALAAPNDSEISFVAAFKAQVEAIVAADTNIQTATSLLGALDKVTGIEVTVKEDDVTHSSELETRTTTLSPTKSPTSSPVELKHSTTPPKKAPTNLLSKSPTPLPTVTLSTSATAKEIWYPDWRGMSGTCKNDGNQPNYMERDGFYYESTRDKCCLRHYHFAYSKCTGGDSVAVGYYPIFDGGFSSGCVNDAKVPDYMRSNPRHWIHSDLKSCCEAHFGWDSTACNHGVQNTGTKKWYADYMNEVCKQDCPGESDACGGLAKEWDPLHNTAAECCGTKLWWIPMEKCVTNASK